MDIKPTPLPCPFCGGTRLKVEYKEGKKRLNFKTRDYEKSLTATVRCNKCHARGPTVSGKLLADEYGPWPWMEGEAIKKWNERSEKST